MFKKAGLCVTPVFFRKKKGRESHKTSPKIFIDGGYKKGCIDWCFLMFCWVIEVVKRSGCAKGFQVLPKRWIVERTFGWLSNYRRMNRDYEHNPKSSENNIKFIVVQIMLKRIAHSP